MTEKRKNRNIISRLTMAAMAVWENKWWILFLAAVAAAVFGWHSAMHREDSAKATLVLRYEQAYEGLNPNGTRFNINELLSDEVVGQAIRLAGLEDSLTPEELLPCIAVGASGSQSPQNMYIATEYTVWLNNECLPDRIRARDMLTLLMESYKQYFLQHYGSNDSALDIDWNDVEDWEYLEFADIMNVKVNNLITYLEDLRSESGMYQYHTEGESFRSLVESVTNFRDIYLNKYTAYVTNQHLFRNAGNYEDKLLYRRFLTSQSLSSNTERYNIYQDALRLYDESMITFVMVPLFDATNGLYMARTSIGMDDLTLNSQSYAEKIETNAKEIKVFDASIANAQNAFRGRDRYAVADEMIEEIKTHMNSLIQRISRVTGEYEEYRYKNSILYSIKDYGIVTGYNLKGAVMAAAATVALCSCYYGIRRIRQEKKR